LAERIRGWLLSIRIRRRVLRWLVGLVGIVALVALALLVPLVRPRVVVVVGGHDCSMCAARCSCDRGFEGSKRSAARLFGKQGIFEAQG